MLKDMKIESEGREKRRGKNEKSPSLGPERVSLSLRNRLGLPEKFRRYSSNELYTW